MWIVCLGLFFACLAKLFSKEVDYNRVLKKKKSQRISYLWEAQTVEHKDAIVYFLAPIKDDFFYIHQIILPYHN